MKTKFSPFFYAMFILTMLTANCYHASGQKPSSKAKLGEPGSGWLVRQSNEGTNMWRMGKAALDPSDSTKLVVTDGNEMVNGGPGSLDIYTEKKYKDVHLELELMIPSKGNSGIYLMGEYEVQVFYSYWITHHNQKVWANGWMGSLVATREPEIHPEKDAGVWQKFEIDFVAPRFDASGKKISNALFKKVVLNGVTIHENVEVLKPTPVNLTGKESAEGPLMLQGFAGQVAYRNIKIKPLK